MCNLQLRGNLIGATDYAVEQEIIWVFWVETFLYVISSNENSLYYKLTLYLYISSNTKLTTDVLIL